jgi:capsular exopolysaccharide synthesis family protein
MEARSGSEEDGRTGDDAGLDLRQYWNVVKKRRWIMLATLAIVIAGSVALTARKPRIFQATATVVVNPQAPKVMGSQTEQVVELGSGSLWGLSEDYYNTQQRIITSRNLVERVVAANPSLLRDPRVVRNPPPGASEEELTKLAVGAIYGRITARLVKASRVIAISVSGGDPQLVTELANMAAQVYIDQNVSVKLDLTKRANRWVAVQLDEAKKRLNSSEGLVVDFKESHDILSVSLEDRQNQLSRDLEKFSNAQSDAQKERSELEAKRKALGRLLAEDPMMFTGGGGETEGALGTAYNQLATLRDTYITERRKLRALEERYGPKHPEVVAQSAFVEAGHQDYLEAGQALVKTLDARIEEVKDAEGRHAARVAQLKTEAFELNKQAQKYKILTRDAEMAEQNYKLLAQRLAESGLQEEDNANNITWLDEAQVPGSPISPNAQRDLAVGIAFGLLLAFGLAFGLEYLDRSIKGQEDVENRLNLPFLGLVPTIELEAREAKQTPELYIARNPNSTVAECCRTVRTNILFSSPDRPLRTLLVSSSNQGEGKTTTVINLGITMAQSGHRTLLVDTDMRRPRLHKGLGVSNEKGVSGVIVGETALEDAVKTTDVPNLYVLPCGPHPPNPAELLQTEKFARLAELLASKYDRVIFDSPPVLAVTDAVVLSRVVDGCVLVARANKTHHDAASRAKRIFAQVKARIVGLVLNDVNLRSATYSSYYNYYNYNYAEPAPPKAERA